MPEQKPNSEQKVETRVTSSPHNGNTIVVSRFSCPEGTIEIIERTYPLNIDFKDPIFEPKRKLSFEGSPIALKNRQVQS